MLNKDVSVENITEKSLARVPLTAEEIKALFSLQHHQQIERLMSGARRIREHFFGDEVFLYGFVYFSTHCRNRCSFCHYAVDSSIKRYRKQVMEVLDVCDGLQEAGVHLIDMTMGEDPYFLADGAARLLDLTSHVSRRVDVPLMVSPGLVSDTVLHKLAELDVTWYACYQETFNQATFAKLRVGQDFSQRLRAKKTAKALQMLTEEGILLNVGESCRDLVAAMLGMRSQAVDQVRVMTYAQPGSKNHPSGKNHPLTEEIVIAIMRHIFPDKLIPASLDIDGFQGLAPRLLAGANVVSSIIPPGIGLNGVSQTRLDINEGRRSVDHVRQVLTDQHLIVAGTNSYRTWLEKRRTSSKSYLEKI